jgi:hypothetical protein
MRQPIDHERRHTAGIRVFGGAFLALLLLGTLAGLTAQTASAQQSTPRLLQCAPHEKIVERLGAKFTEAPTSLGLASNGNVVELFSAEDGETWTIVMTAPQGTSCIMASGRYWQDLPIKPDGPEV